MQKLYCYVDETGQNTKGRLFIVSVIVTEGEREELARQLEEIEKASKKGPGIAQLAGIGCMGRVGARTLADVPVRALRAASRPARSCLSSGRDTPDASVLCLCPQRHL